MTHPGRRASDHRSLARAVLVTAALLVPAQHAVATRIYQWQDENGNTVFSERRPPKGGNAAVVELKSGKTATDAEQQLERARAQFAAPKPAEAPKEPALTPEQKARRADACAQAREALAILQGNNRPRYQADDGQLIVMDDALKAARIADAEQKIGEYCD